MGSHLESLAAHPQGQAYRQDLAQSLAEGLEQLGLTVDDSVQAALLEYLALLSKWNQVYNLTAIRDPQSMLVQHLLDSLAVVPSLKRHWEQLWGQPRGQHHAAMHMRPPELADIGSGGGLPAIPIALVWPQVRYTLVESVSKKAAFLRQVLGSLGLTDRVRVMSQRVQSVPTSVFFDLITCRAYATLADFARDVEAISGEQTRLVALKGHRPDSEIESVSPPWVVDEVEEIIVPFLDAQRHLVWLRRE
jgi:16S rRNA (guanine527-N7)-methyltransferase